MEIGDSKGIEQKKSAVFKNTVEVLLLAIERKAEVDSETGKFRVSKWDKIEQHFFPDFL